MSPVNVFFIYVTVYMVCHIAFWFFLRIPISLLSLPICSCMLSASSITASACVGVLPAATCRILGTGQFIKHRDIFSHGAGGWDVQGQELAPGILWTLSSCVHKWQERENVTASVLGKGPSDAGDPHGVSHSQPWGSGLSFPVHEFWKRWKHSNQSGLLITVL